jgi:hypothetical protein
MGFTVAFIARFFRHAECSLLIQESITPAPGLINPLGAEGRADSLFGQRRWMNGVVDKPRPVVVPKVMPRIRGIHPNCYYCTIHDT